MSSLMLDEALLREPNLWVPGKKPLGPIKLDESNPLTNGIVRYWPCNSLNDINGHKLITDRGTVNIGTGPKGPMITPSIASTPYGTCTELEPTPISGSQNRTVLGGVYAYNTSGNAGIFTIGYGDTGPTGERWTFRSLDDWLRIEIQGSGYNTGTRYMTYSNYHFVGCRLNGTTLGDHTLFCDEFKENATGPGGVNTASTNSIRFGQPYNTSDSTKSMSGYVWMALWNRALSDEEITDIRLDPYQLVMPA